MKKILLTCLLACFSMAFAQDTMTEMAGPPAPTEEEMAMYAKVAKRWGLPEGTMMVGGCVPGMGEHWANPEDLPFGPIYGFMDGDLVFVEVMISQEDFANGESWTEQLMSPKSYKKIDHVDIEFEPEGHEGYPIPHYDVHAYFVPHSDHTEYCLPDEDSMEDMDMGETPPAP